MAVVIPITTKYDGGKGFTDAERDAKRAQQAATRATREQIAEHRRFTSLTAKLDRDLASEQKRQAKELADFKGKLRTGAGAAALAGGILVGAGVEAVGAARESIAAEAELQAALNSTGQAAAGYKAELAGLANELQNTSNFSDEAVMHAETLLLTFTKIGRGVLPDATRAVADIATLMGGDMQAAAIQVGKALNDPIKGLGALTRIGVTFSQQQKDQIKAMVEAGDVAGAQAVILAELNKEFGGQAQAARDAAGGTQDLKVSFGELQESVGKLLLAIGDGGVTGAVGGFLDKLNEGAQAWTGAIENIQLLAKANDILADKTGEAAAMEKYRQANIAQANAESDALFGWLQKLIGAQVQGSASAEDFGAAVQQAAQEQAAAKAAAEGNAKALLTEGDAAEDDAKSQEELEKALKAANAARRDIAGSLIDITEKAAADSARVNEDFAKEDAALLSDHYEANQKITADAEKERLQNEKQLAKDLLDVDKDLAKDLAKLDKDLAKDKAKLDRDTNKQITRMQQDAAREEKQQRRARQIDARGDQRLFNFDMRQLAAEGEFNAIQQAMERREIEKQIEAEKLTEEQRAADDNQRIEIDRVRQDADERKREMEAEAEERKTELETAAQERRDQLTEQAAEEEVRRQEELTQALADEQASYDERQAALVAARDEKLAAIEEGKQAAIAKLAEELTETGDLTKEELAALIPLAGEFGEDAGAAFASGLSAGFARNQRIDQMVAGLGTGQGDTDRPSSRPGAQNRNPAPPPRPSSRPGAQNRRFAEGGAFTVGGVGGPDSQLVEFMATPGERVIVQPAGGGGGGGIVINQTINGGGEELARRIAAVTKAAAERELERFYSEVIVPWAGGG